MELSVQQFLDSVSNPNTKKEYRHGLKKFCQWFGKSAEQENGRTLEEKAPRN